MSSMTTMIVSRWRALLLQLRRCFLVVARALNHFHCHVESLSHANLLFAAPDLSERSLAQLLDEFDRFATQLPCLLRYGVECHHRDVFFLDLDRLSHLMDPATRRLLFGYRIL
ncbi:hypothetical protein PENTCL1PPCAC_24103 [Pristionchus entomophagus]|uniref:Secreted protein n=1 Tax=Pristionchus entomophagus TaxID=358040 RepID=A0AAV5U727_9BILA|nr:hypothetical protein PENTCL1PPCAC_24103 [Pristionchus entomophagus]